MEPDLAALAFLLGTLNRTRFSCTSFFVGPLKILEFAYIHICLQCLAQARSHDLRIAII
jgi:hypothetical protein